MLQKIKMTSYAFILFLVFAFSFIALQVTTEEVEAAPGVCEPVERIRNMKDTARHSDYKVWEERCQVSGSNGQCGNRTEWPAGDGGRCETTADDTVAAQDDAGVCLPNARLQARRDDNKYQYWVGKCASQPQGSCETVGWGKGRCAMSSEVDTVAAQDVNPTVAPVNVAEFFNRSLGVSIPNKRECKQLVNNPHVSQKRMKNYLLRDSICKECLMYRVMKNFKSWEECVTQKF